ncbi:hypothetical protein [Fulvimarina sp. MAC8]|uniref:hypothetical protein n=1 Tax=Fulvimarina sp. MAC8 TaxID=3162874 RepID=UPI0032ECC464
MAVGDRIRARAPTQVVRQLALTVVLILVAMTLSHIPLPGLKISADPMNFETLVRAASVVTVAGGAWMHAYLVVQTLALALPQRVSRFFANNGFVDPFARSVVIFAIPISVMQAIGIVAGLESSANLTFVFPDYALSTVIIGATGGMIIWITLGSLIERMGTGGGFWLLLVINPLSSLVPNIGSAFELLRAGVLPAKTLLLSLLAYLAVFCGVTLLLLARRNDGLTRAEPIVLPLFLGSFVYWIVLPILVPASGEYGQPTVLYGLLFAAYGTLPVIGTAIATALVALRFASFEKAWRQFPFVAMFLVVVGLAVEVALRYGIYAPIDAANTVLVAAIAVGAIVGVRERMSSI